MNIEDAALNFFVHVRLGLDQRRAGRQLDRGVRRDVDRARDPVGARAPRVSVPPPAASKLLHPGADHVVVAGAGVDRLELRDPRPGANAAPLDSATCGPSARTTLGAATPLGVTTARGRGLGEGGGGRPDDDRRGDQGMGGKADRTHAPVIGSVQQVVEHQRRVAVRADADRRDPAARQLLEEAHVGAGVRRQVGERRGRRRCPRPSPASTRRPASRGGSRSGSSASRRRASPSTS